MILVELSVHVLDSNMDLTLWSLAELTEHVLHGQQHVSHLGLYTCTVVRLRCP